MTGFFEWLALTPPWQAGDALTDLFDWEAIGSIATAGTLLWLVADKLAAARAERKRLANVVDEFAELILIAEARTERLREHGVEKWNREMMSLLAVEPTIFDDVQDQIRGFSTADIRAAGIGVHRDFALAAIVALRKGIEEADHHWAPSLKREIDRNRFTDIVHSLRQRANHFRRR